MRVEPVPAKRHGIDRVVRTRENAFHFTDFPDLAQGVGGPPRDHPVTFGPHPEPQDLDKAANVILYPLACAVRKLVPFPLVLVNPAVDVSVFVPEGVELFGKRLLFLLEQAGEYFQFLLRFGPQEIDFSPTLCSPIMDSKLNRTRCLSSRISGRLWML